MDDATLQSCMLSSVLLSYGDLRKLKSGLVYKLCVPQGSDPIRCPTTSNLLGIAYILRYH
jgi:hypothetical protein